MSDREKTLEEVLARAEAAIQAEAAPRKPEAQSGMAEVVQLPLWAEPVRGVPNALIRSALFAAIQGPNRRAMKREVVASVQGMEIRYTGFQLNQTDLDVWNEFVHLSKVQAMGSRCAFSAHGLLKALGRQTGKSNHEWLKDTIARITACLIEVNLDSQRVYGGHLIEEFDLDDADQRYILRLNPKMIRLFDAGWTAIERGQRDVLRKKPLAQWLQLWYANHASPYPMKVETYRELSGSGTKQLWKFRQNLKAALTEVQLAGAIASWRLDESDLVHIENKPSLAQVRHLRSRGRPRLPLR